MMSLVTLDELRTWTRESIQSTEDIDFANAVIEAVSLRVSEVLDHPTWLADPDNVNTKGASAVAVQVARRTYLNPDQEVRTSSIGPIGGVSYLEDFAQSVNFTTSEMERLDALADAAGTGGGGLFTITMERDLPWLDDQDIVLEDSAGSGILYANGVDSWAF